MIEVTCPDCSSQYELPDEDAGIQAQCACGRLIDVPGSSASPASIPLDCFACGNHYELGHEDAGCEVQCACGQLLVVPATSDAESSQRSVLDAAATIPVECPACGGRYEVDAEDAGIEVQCPCGTVMTVPNTQQQPEITSTDSVDQIVSETDSEIDTASTASASSELQCPSKKGSWAVPTLIGIGSLTLIVSLIVVMNRDGTRRIAAQPEFEQTVEIESDTAGLADPATWQGWVRDESAAIILIRPKQMLESPLLAELPLDSIVGSIESTLGAAPQQVEEISIIVDSPDPEVAAPAFIVFVRFAVNADRRRIVNSVLPDAEPVSMDAGTLFQGSMGSFYFPDDSTAVFADSKLLQSLLPNLKSRRLSTNPLLQRIAECPQSDIDAFITPTAISALPERSRQFAAGIVDAEFHVRLSGKPLLHTLIMVSEDAAGVAVNQQLSKLKQSPATVAGEFVSSFDSEANEEASTQNVVTSLIGGLTVSRNGTLFNIQLKHPAGLAQSLRAAIPQLETLLASLPLSGRTSRTPLAGSREPAKPETQKADSTGGLTAKSGITLPTAPKEKFRTYARAHDRFIEIYTVAEGLKEQIAEATDADQAALQKQRLERVAEAAGVLRVAERLAVQLADQNGDREKLLQSRYLLAYLYSELNLHYETGLLGSYVARTDTPDSKRAKPAAFLSLMSWQAAFQEASADDRIAELDQFAKAATLLSDKWPDDPQLDRIRYVVGQFQQLEGKQAASAEWYARVTEAAPQYADAQIASGQAYWREWRALSHHLAVQRDKPMASETDSSASSPPVVAHAEERDAATAIETRMAQLPDLAEKHLMAGITATQAREKIESAESLLAAKLTLAELRLRDGSPAETIDLLTAEPWPVMPAVAVEDESLRPDKGVQSREFATAAWQLLLKAAVSSRRLEQAQDAMTQLERVAGSTDAAKLTTVYLQLGKDLFEELKNAEPEHAARMRSSFGEFLTVLAGRKRQTFGSLFWIGETATAFAGSSQQPADSQKFHQQASSAWQSIIDRAARERGFCSVRTVSIVRMRLARSLQSSGEFERAVQIVAGLLALQPNSYSTQFEAAAMLQEWGTVTAEKGHLLEAIQGRGDSLWGWGRASITLQRLLDSDAAKPEHRDMMLEARHNLVLCRRLWSLAQSGREKTDGLEKSLQAIRTTAQISDSLDGIWWDRLDELYQTIQRDLGRTPESIRSLVSAAPRGS